MPRAPANIQSRATQQSFNGKSHKDMKLKRVTGRVLMLGECAQPMDKLVPDGQTCSRCGGYDHFARVCLEPIPGHMARDTDGKKSNHNYKR